MIGDITLTSCGGFPPFARVTGKFGLLSANLMQLEANPSVRATLSSIRANPVLFRNLLNGAGQPTETPTIDSRLKAHRLLKWGAFGLYASGTSANWGWHGQYVASQFDWLQYSSSIRQSGWTGGINIHSVGQIIRRRAGTSIASCTYYQCKRNTNSPIKRGDVWIVGHNGTDPALLPEYWQLLAVAPTDSQSINTFVVGSFFDAVNNAVIGDWKVSLPGLLYSIDQTHLTGLRVCSIDRMEIGDASGEISNGMAPPTVESGTVPFPIWIRSAVIATFATGVWTFGNPHGYTIHGADQTKLPAGFFVVENAGRLFRVKAETPFPPAQAPSLLPALFDEQNVAEIYKRLPNSQLYDPKLSMDSLDDRLMPSVQITSVGINQANGTLGAVAYNQRLVYARLDAKTQFISMYGYEDDLSSVTTTKLETPGQWIADQTDKEGIYEVAESYDLSCGDSLRFSPASITTHPLKDPSEAMGGSKIGHCKLYFEVPYRDAPRASVPLPGSVEWISAIPRFARPGDWIEVEWWTWHGKDSFGAFRLEQKYKGIGSPSGTGWTEIAGNQYELERVDRLYFLTPFHFPCPGGQSGFYTTTWNNNAYGPTGTSQGVIAESCFVFSKTYNYDTGTYIAVPRWNTSPGAYWYPSQIVDTRSIDEARHCIYQNRPHSFIRNIKSTSNEQVIDYAPVRFPSQQQPKTNHLSWCSVTMSRSDNPLSAVTNAINPCVVIRHKLNLTSSSQCG